MENVITFIKITCPYCNTITHIPLGEDVMTKSCSVCGYRFKYKENPVLTEGNKKEE